MNKFIVQSKIVKDLLIKILHFTVILFLFSKEKRISKYIVSFKYINQINPKDYALKKIVKASLI